jgi:hypothetical protein
VIKTYSNAAKVRDSHELSRFLRQKWMTVPGLQVEVCNGAVVIWGNIWPEVYRIPDDMPWALCWPGKAGLLGPLGIDGVLADIGPYLEEKLVVTTTGDRKGRWAILPGSTNVLKFISGQALSQLYRVTPVDLACCRGRNGDFRARVFQIRDSDPQTNPTDQIRLTGFSNKRGLRPPMGIMMSKRDALLLGLALVHAAAGSYDRQSLQQAFDEHLFLLEEPYNGKESD